MKNNLYTLFFAACLGIVCALLLTAAAEFTKERRKANKDAEEMRNILTALKIPFEAKANPVELVGIYESHVKKSQDPELFIYQLPGEKHIQAVATRFAGPGLWGPVKGFLAFEADRKTIRGITFYEQEETPGLGGEIVTAGFRNLFAGKKVFDSNGNIGIVITAPGKAKGQNEIDGITGATMTCDKLQAMLNEAIKKVAVK